MTLFSDALLWEAWERVQENAGCAGADGVTIAQFARAAARNIERLMERVEQGTYRTFPLLTIVVEKRPNSNKTRRLLVPTVGDRVLQTAAARMEYVVCYDIADDARRSGRQRRCWISGTMRGGVACAILRKAFTIV
jgi:hypothetical protein